MSSWRALGPAIALFAGGGAGCTLVLDFEARVPCATAENCAEGYRCVRETCAPDDGEVICGDRVVEGDEPCDDGNDVENDLCDTTCELYRYPGPCTIEVDRGADGVTDSRATYTFDDRNYSETYAWDEDLDGVIDARTYFYFDDYGREIRSELDADGDLDGNTDTDGWIEYTYGLDDHLARVEQDDDPDDDTTYAAIYEWSGEELVGSWDLDGDGTADAEVRTRYDARDLPQEVTWDRNLDGVVDDRRLWTYDVNGFLVRWERDRDGDNDGNTDPDVIEEISHDDRGNVTRVDTDEGADDVIDQRDLYRYDCWPAL